MIGVYPLLKDVISRLAADTLIAEYAGGTVDVMTERPAEDNAPPFIVVEAVDVREWSTQSYTGDEITLQASVYVTGQEQGTRRGIRTPTMIASRIRDVLHDIDGFDLDETASDGPDLAFDLLTDSHTETGKSVRLVLRQFQSAVPDTGPDGVLAGYAVRFRCLVGYS